MYKFLCTIQPKMKQVVQNKMRIKFGFGHFFRRNFSSGSEDKALLSSYTGDLFPRLKQLLNLIQDPVQTKFFSDLSTMGVVPNIRTSQAVLLYTGNFLL